MLSSDIEKRIGGKMIKIADKATLGLPDSVHVKNGICTWIETKIGSGEEIINGSVYAQPWKCAEKDLRQFEVCKSISKHSLVLYSIYYPSTKISAVLDIRLMEIFRDNPNRFLTDSLYIRGSRGVDQILMFMEENIRRILKNENNRAVSKRVS